jgi:hypothetical protein
MEHLGRARWFWCACVAGVACARSSIHTASPVADSPHPQAQGTSTGAALSSLLATQQALEPTECKPIASAAHDPGAVVSESENERLGLVCSAKAARYVCPRDDGRDCRDRFRVLVDEKGEPLEQQFRRSHWCIGTPVLYGCNRKGGGEVIPFIHSEPIEFTPSGFALVAEEYREDTQQGGYFYVDSHYEQKLEALTIDGIPEPWLPLSVVRYRKDGKIGFLNLRSGKITDSIFKGAFSFYESSGRTLVCEDCQPKRWDVCAPPEAQCSGTAYLIDERGKRLSEKPSERYAEYWWCKRHRGEKFQPPGDSCD